MRIVALLANGFQDLLMACSMSRAYCASGLCATGCN